MTQTLTTTTTTIEDRACALLHPELAQAVRQRTEFGIRKYGQRLDDNHQPMRAWLIHIIQEALDGCQYALRADEVALAGEFAEIANDLQERHQLTAAEIMAGGKH